tara:strand:+ start:32 stop:229 length:198 start_codon:yes stop_codon:yes gene_type:complete
LVAVVLEELIQVAELQELKVVHHPLVLLAQLVEEEEKHQMDQELLVDQVVGLLEIIHIQEPHQVV